MFPIISCEHAGNYVPEEYARIFRDKAEILESHRAWDPGAWDVAKSLSEQLATPAFGCFTTRLLVEANRSLHHPQLFSSFTAPLDEVEKSKLLNNIYFPYRTEVFNSIKTARKPVLHLSLHSFTPVLDGRIRKTDVGILFDPDRNEEAKFSERLKLLLQKSLPEKNIEFNAPYLGIDDGFTTYLRTQFSGHEYLGIELELNQKFINTETWSEIKQGLAKTLKSMI